MSDPLQGLIDHSVLTNVLRDILARLKNQENTTQALQAQMDNKNAEIAALQEQLKDSRAGMGNLKKQLDALTLRVDALEDKLTAVPGLINELRDRLNSLARVVGEGGGGGKAADLERLAERVKQVETLAANHTVELRDISKDTQANRTDIAGLTKRVSELESTTLNKADKSELSATNKRVSDLEDQLRKLQGLLAQLEALVNGDHDKLAQLASAQDRTAAQLAQLLAGRKDGQGQGERVVERVIERAAPATRDLGLSSGFGPGGLSKDAMEKEIGELWRREKALTAQMQDLAAKLRELQGTVEGLARKDEERARQIRDILDQLARVADLAAKNSAAASYDYATRAYVDGKYDDLLKKLKQLEKAMAKALKTELKQFERDIMVFMDDSRKEMTNASEAAVGKIHFRCLSCDQYTSSQHGPSTYLFAAATGGQPTLAAPPPPGVTQMAITRGDELSLYGRDGQVYKGRDDTTVTITPGDSARKSQFQVAYSDKSQGNRSRPQSASGARSPSAPGSARPRTAGAGAGSPSLQSARDKLLTGNNSSRGGASGAAGALRSSVPASLVHHSHPSPRGAISSVTQQQGGGLSQSQVLTLEEVSAPAAAGPASGGSGDGKRQAASAWEATTTVDLSDRSAQSQSFAATAPLAASMGAGGNGSGGGGPSVGASLSVRPGSAAASRGRG